MSDNTRIIEQTASDKMQGEMLRVLRKLLSGKAVCAHKEILEAMEGVHHPIIEVGFYGERITQEKKGSELYKSLYEKIDRQRQQAINEIGVPSSDYPANIANAYDILMGNGICKGQPQ